MMNLEMENTLKTEIGGGAVLLLPACPEESNTNSSGRSSGSSEATTSSRSSAATAGGPADNNNERARVQRIPNLQTVAPKQSQDVNVNRQIEANPENTKEVTVASSSVMFVSNPPKNCKHLYHFNSTYT